MRRSGGQDRPAGPAGRDHGRPTSGARDRHGRGLRGPLAPPEVPAVRTRAEQFDDLVLDAVEEVERAVRDDAALAARVSAVALAVEEVPPGPRGTGGGADLAADLAPDVPVDDPVPLARSEPEQRGQPARVVLYRRPIELRTPDPADREMLVHEVVVDELAELLGVSVERLDPEDD